MGETDLRSIHLFVATLAALSLFVSASAQPVAADDPESNFVRDLVVVAPTKGPAWWRVSKGSATVWILALPPSNIPEDLEWDRSALTRRLRAAHILIMPPEGRSHFEGGWNEAFPELVTSQLKRAARSAGVPPQRYLPATLPTVVALRDYYFRTESLNLPIEKQVMAEARRRRVPIERANAMDVALTPRLALANDPEIQTCAIALLKEVETDPQAFQDMGLLWARGRVAELISRPRSPWTYCINRMLPGYSRRAIDAQTAAIARVLDRRRKAVAVAPLRLLVAEDGILQRLKARGYVVADPQRPLAD